MLRYVAAIRAGASAEAYGAICARLSLTVLGPARVSRPGLAIWVRQSGPGPLSLTEASSEVFIGKQFGKANGEAWGAFVRITPDPATGDVEVYRDPSGRIECWSATYEGVTLIFSHLADVSPAVVPAPAVNWDYIRYHLRHEWNHGHECGLEGVREILAGEKMTIRRGANASHQELSWDPAAISRNRFDSPDEARKAIREAAAGAVDAWSSAYGNILLNLSGGLDSAIVLGLLRRTRPAGSMIASNLVISREEGDEREYAQEAARLHGVRLVEIPMKPQQIAPIGGERYALLRPTMRSTSLGYDDVDDEIITRHGTQSFWTGTGGDHLFYDNLRSIAAADYMSHTRDPVGVVRTAHALAQASDTTVWDGLGAAVKEIGRRQVGNTDPALKDNPYTDGLLAGASDVARFAHPWSRFEGGYVPPAKRRQIMNLIELRRHYWRYGRADKSDECHPLVSQGVIEACLRTPAYWFAHGGVQRGLVREAFSDLLPQAIRTRRFKSINPSHWVDSLTKSLSYLRPLMLEGRLQKKGLVRRDRLEQVLTPIGLSTTQKIMPLVVCLTTEMWLQSVPD